MYLRVKLGSPKRGFPGGRCGERKGRSSNKTKIPAVRYIATGVKGNTDTRMQHMQVSQTTNPFELPTAVARFPRAPGKPVSI